MLEIAVLFQQNAVLPYGFLGRLLGVGHVQPDIGDGIALRILPIEFSGEGAKLLRFAPPGMGAYPRKIVLFGGRGGIGARAERGDKGEGEGGSRHCAPRRASSRARF
ncbi:MAG TPA: hypothetical protein PLY45_06750 [bacterium]|nr:hypothetical protein [bacterium]